MDIKVVIANFLICKEVTVWCNWKIVLFQETIQLLHTSVTWVLHQVLHELNHGFNRKAILQHIDHSSSKRTVEFFILPEQLFALNAYIALTIVQNYFLRINDIFYSFPITFLDSFQHLIVSNVCLTDSVRCATNNYGNIITLNQIRERHLKLLLKCQLN